MTIGPSPQLEANASTIPDYQRVVCEYKIKDACVFPQLIAPIPHNGLFELSEPKPLANAVTDNDVIEKQVDEMMSSSKTTLYEHQVEAKEDGLPGVSEDAIAACLSAIPHIATIVIFDSNVRWATFGKDDGNASLAIQSMRTQRRASFIFSTQGRLGNVLITDKAGAVKNISLTGGVDELRKYATWVCMAR